MNNNEPDTLPDPAIGYIFQNDIVALKQAFSLPDIDYADISQREQLAAALKRWPLLAEFAQQSRGLVNGRTGIAGVRGGVGTTTITAALAWSLQMLGENVLVVDACPDNLLRLSFNVDFTHRQGWARAMLDGQDWRERWVALHLAARFAAFWSVIH